MKEVIEKMKEVIAMGIFEHDNLGPAPATEKERVAYRKEAQRIVEALLALNWDCENPECRDGQIETDRHEGDYIWVDCPSCNGTGESGKPMIGIIKRVQEVPENPYKESIFPRSENEVIKIMRDKGITDDELTGISGCFCRIGWNLNQQSMIDASFVQLEKE